MDERVFMELHTQHRVRGRAQTRIPGSDAALTRNQRFLRGEGALLGTQAADRSPVDALVVGVRQRQ